VTDAETVATAAAVGSAVAGFAVWAMRAVLAKEITPTLIRLGVEAAALTKEFAAHRETKDEERRETTAILRDLEKIVQDHETRITLLEQPPARPTTRRRRSS
jgi:hypothetical protein